MKKAIIILMLIVVPLVFSTTVLAQANQQGQQGQGVQQQDKVQDPTTHEDETIISQEGNQVQTQNQGEGSQLQVASQQMEQLMNMDGLDEEVGNQVREIAQEQVKTQTQVQTQLNKLESRSNLAKKLLGPDYKAIKNLRQQMEQNQLRIQELEKLQAQITNQSDEVQLEEAVQALVEQNTALEDQVQAEEQIKSLFGWLIRLFY